MGWTGEVVRRSTCRIAATRHAQVEQDDMCAPRARQSRMKISEGMTFAPPGGKRGRVCVSAPCALAPARVASVRAQQPARARGAHYRNRRDGRSFLNAWTEFSAPNVRRHETAVAALEACPCCGVKQAGVSFVEFRVFV